MRRCSRAGESETPAARAEHEHLSPAVAISVGLTLVCKIEEARDAGLVLSDHDRLRRRDARRPDGSPRPRTDPDPGRQGAMDRRICDFKNLDGLAF
jgi:hypothetical protein